MANFTRVKPSGWATNEILTSAQMNSLDIDHAKAINGDDGSIHGGDVEVGNFVCAELDVDGDIDLGTSFTEIDGSGIGGTDVKVKVKDTTGVFVVKDVSGATVLSAAADNNGTITSGGITNNGGAENQIKHAPNSDDYADTRYYKDTNIPTATYDTVVTDAFADGDVAHYNVTILGWGKTPSTSKYGTIEKVYTVRKTGGTLTVGTGTVIHSDQDGTLGVDVDIVESSGNAAIRAKNDSGLHAIEADVWIRRTYFKRS